MNKKIAITRSVDFVSLMIPSIARAFSSMLGSMLKKTKAFSGSTLRIFEAFPPILDRTYSGSELKNYITSEIIFAILGVQDKG